MAKQAYEVGPPPKGVGRNWPRMEDLLAYFIFQQLQQTKEPSPQLLKNWVEEFQSVAPAVHHRHLYSENVSKFRSYFLPYDFISPKASEQP